MKVHLLSVLGRQSEAISGEDLALRQVCWVEVPVLGTERVAAVSAAVVLCEVSQTLHTEEAAGVLRPPAHRLVLQDELPRSDVPVGHQVPPILRAPLNPPRDTRDISLVLT